MQGIEEFYEVLWQDQLFQRRAGQVRMAKLVPPLSPLFNGAALQRVFNILFKNGPKFSYKPDATKNVSTAVVQTVSKY